MATFDWIVLVVYMIIVMGVGTWAGKNNESESDYFQGGRNIPWYAVGISVGMTMLSAGGFIGNPGWAYADGLLIGVVNVIIPICIVFSTLTILPMIYDSGVTTIGEFLQLRFGSKTRMVALIVWLMNSFVLIGGFVYTPSLVLQNVTGVSLNVWVPIIVVLAIIYTVVGGIKAVIWTDVLQGVILLIGVIAGLFLAVNAVDMSLSEVLSVAGEAGHTTTFLFDFKWDNYNIWMAFFAGFICWVSYFGFNQEQIQRYVTARSVRDIKKTGITSSVVMMGIYWLCYILGIVLFVFYQTNEPTLDLANSNNVFVDFILNHMPTGLVGILLAAVFAAAMSSLDSVLNSATAVFTKDIYEKYISKGKEATFKQSMIFTIIIGIIVVIFVYLYLGESSSSIMQTIGSMSAPLQGTLTGIMFSLLFFKSVNDKGCAIGSTIAILISFFIKNNEAAWGIHWMWGYVYSAGLGLILSYIISVMLPNKEESEKAYQYTLQGTIERMKDTKDATGYEIRPLKFDIYAVLTIAVFVVLCAVLAYIQTF